MAKERTSSSQTTWLDKPLFGGKAFNWEILLLVLLLVAAFVTRFYHLGDRVMSHDETTHVYFSWQLFKGQGYQHHPLSHGPLQFHLLALSYFLFGDNDFTARIPQALFGAATIVFVWWAFRRYIGRIGAMIAAFLYLISPYMLYYSRYARNEAFVALFGLVMLWATLKYLDKGQTKYIYICVAAIALHFTSKETSFIYLAQLLIFLGLLFVWRVAARKWKSRNSRLTFIVTLLLAASLLFLAIGAQVQSSEQSAAISGTQVEEPVVATEVESQTTGTALAPTTLILGGAAAASVIVCLVALVRGYGWQRLRQERAFNLMLLLFSLVLPHLAAFPVRWLHHDPLDYQNPDNLLFIAIAVAVCTLVSAAIGAAWNWRTWLISSAIFYAIFVPFYTTIFSNGVGFFSGLVGSLGYWLEQQAVERGNQPSYYYWGVQIPLYEFLAAAGSLAAAVIGLGIWRGERNAKPGPDSENRNLTTPESRRLALVLFAFWAVSSLAAYSIAGEKMPWLTVHIALPMLLLAGWAIAWLIKRTDWGKLRSGNGWLLLASTVVFLIALLGTLGRLFGPVPPFQGNEQAQLQATNHFTFYLLTTALSAYGIYYFMAEGKWDSLQYRRLVAVTLFGGLAVLTAHIAFRASYLKYDYATEYLVYAHMAPGPKEALRQIEEISRRTTDGLDLQVAYDNETSYPFWWYLRNYPNQRYYADQPNRDLRQFPVIIVGDTNYGKIEPVVGQSYYMFEYSRIWWPNQDYFDFTFESVGYGFTSDTGQPASEMSRLEYFKRAGQRLWGYFGNPQTRADLFKIWLNGDFTDYLEHKGQDASLAAWNPSRTMRVYIRKDVAAQIWDYGVQAATPEEVLADPYEGKGLALAADVQVGSLGAGLGQFNSPRNLAVAPDGSVYVADANNHRIQHLAADGSQLAAWGSFADISAGDAPGGRFNEPWSVAVSPDGQFVYVADTWNHRIQKFSTDGQFLTMWGTFGQDDGPDALWGPRDILVDNEGNVLVTDTGNKRIRVYDANGEFISQYGEFGFDAGQFDEPVGLALDRNSGRLYVADTWNQRVQVFDYAGGVFTPVTTWEIAGWYGQSLTNKPYLSVGGDGRVYISDPEAGRILVYNPDGTVSHYFGGYDQAAVNIGIAQGVAASPLGGVWVTDSQNGAVLHFSD